MQSRSVPLAAVCEMVQVCRALAANRKSQQVPRNAARSPTGGDRKKAAARATKVRRTAESEVAAGDKAGDRQVKKKFLWAARRRREGLARSTPRLAAAQGMASLLPPRSGTDATRGQYSRALDKFKDVAALGTGDDLTMKAASSPLIPVLGRLAVLRQLLAAYLGADAQCFLLRIAATSSSALTTLLGFRSRSLARVSVFDRHLAEVRRPAG